MTSATYESRRNELERYFDRTAVDMWIRMTSDAPLSRVRRTVRAGRDRMRSTLLSWLPEDLSGARVLDAGCGTGAFAVALARRGASVVGVDVSPTLVDLARERSPSDLGPGAIDFRAADMLDPSVGTFDYVVAMDSLIHYDGADMVRTVASLAERTRIAVLFTIAPRTPALSLMHAVGRMLPRNNRAPAIEPIAQVKLEAAFARDSKLAHWRVARAERIASGFYISQALELATR